MASDARSDRTLVLATRMACAATLCALFWPAAARRVFVYLDLGNFFLPMRIYLAESLARGETPLWMSNLFCGLYAHGEGQIGIFHPLRWLAYRLLPVSEAFNAECLAPYPFALAGAALFFRRLALPPAAALFGGLSFAFSSYLTVRLTHPNAIAVIAHLGWVLWAIDVVLRDAGRRRWLAWAALALLTGSQLLVGYPVAIAYCWLIALPYALFVAASRRQLGQLVGVAGSLAAGVLIGGIQMVPTWESIWNSPRAHATLKYLSDQSLHPWNLLQVVGPWLFRDRIYQDGVFNPVEQTFYLGAVAPIAAVWVAMRWRELGELRALVASAGALCAAALVLALGRNTPVHGAILALPVLGTMRVPARYSLVLFFASAIVSAIAFADLQRGAPSAERRRQARWIWAVPALSWIAAGVALALAASSKGTSGFAGQVASPGWVVLGPVVFTLAAALFIAAIRGPSWPLYGLVALMLTDQAHYAATLWWTEPPRTLAAYRAGIERVPVTPPERLATRGDSGTYQRPGGRELSWSTTPFILNGVWLVTGYVGMPPMKKLDYLEDVKSQRVAGASVRIGTSKSTGVERVEGPLPRARMVARAAISKRPLKAIRIVDVVTTAIVEERIGLVDGPPGEAAIEVDAPGHVRIAASAPTRQLLVLAESFHEGWRVAVDGVVQHPIRVYGDFLGVPLDAGDHRVEFTFAPKSFEQGRMASLAGLVFVAAVAVFALVGYQRPPSTRNSAPVVKLDAGLAR